MKGSLLALAGIIGVLCGVLGAYFFTTEVPVSPPKQNDLLIGGAPSLRGYITYIDSEAHTILLRSPSRYRAGVTEAFVIAFTGDTVVSEQGSAAKATVNTLGQVTDRSAVVQLAAKPDGKIEAANILIL